MFSEVTFFRNLPKASVQKILKLINNEWTILLMLLGWFWQNPNFVTCCEFISICHKNFIFYFLDLATLLFMLLGCAVLFLPRCHGARHLEDARETRHQAQRRLHLRRQRHVHAHQRVRKTYLSLFLSFFFCFFSFLFFSLFFFLSFFTIIIKGNHCNNTIFHPRFLLKGMLYGFYIYIYDNYRIYALPWDSIWTWIIAAIGSDLGYYWVHRAAHGM